MRDIIAENSRAWSVSPDRVLASDRCDRSTLRHSRGRSGGAIGSGGLARVNRHKGRFVSRELNGLWSQSPAIDLHLRTRSAVRPVPCRYNPVPVSVFVPLPRISAIQPDGSIRPVGEEIPASELSDRVRELHREDREISPRTCKRLYSALVIRSCSRKSPWSIRAFLRVLNRIAIRDLNCKRVTSFRIIYYDRYVRRALNSKFSPVTRVQFCFQVSVLCEWNRRAFFFPWKNNRDETEALNY